MDLSWIHAPSSLEMALQAGLILYVVDLVRKTHKYTIAKQRRRLPPDSAAEGPELLPLPTAQVVSTPVRKAA